jgi:MOSC domain-containing protein YiiM
MAQGTVVSIYIAAAASAPTVFIPEVRAIPGKGLEGDRYFSKIGTYSNNPGSGRDVTLIEIETLEALKRDYGIELELGESRRNIVTRGVSLNHLIGRDFRIGEVTLRGMRLCEPCSHLEGLSRKGVQRALIHRGGLRADVIAGGIIRVGDPVVELTSERSR